MSLRATRPILIVVALAIGNPGRELAAQATPDSVKHRNNCRLAAQVVRTGQPAPHRDWAFGYILSCGGAGVGAVVDAWSKLSSVSDTAELRAFLRWVGTSRHPDLLSSFLATGGSASATPEARIEAWKMILRYARPAAGLDDEELDRRPIDAVCAVAYSSGSRPTELAPLPADYLSRIRAAAIATQSDHGAPDRVRRAAYCVSQYADFALYPME